MHSNTGGETTWVACHESRCDERTRKCHTFCLAGTRTHHFVLGHFLPSRCDFGIAERRHPCVENLRMHSLIAITQFPRWQQCC
jgi:hypothetical protein